MQKKQKRHKLFDPVRNNRVLKKRDSRLTNKWNIGQLDSVIRNKDRAGSEVNVRIYNGGNNSARLTDGVVNVEVTYTVRDMAKSEWVTGSLKMDTDTDSEQPEFTTILDKHF